MPYIAGLIVLFSITICGPVLSESLPTPEFEQLIIFLQPCNSKVETDFRKNQLPQIRNLAKEMNVAVVEVE